MEFVALCVLLLVTAMSLPFCFMSTAAILSALARNNIVESETFLILRLRYHISQCAFRFIVYVNCALCFSIDY